jgi:MTH538 TIR-like domain (DUF1863)
MVSERVVREERSVRDADAYRFAAFISYRNEGIDPTWARWLQRHLESWRTPGALVRAGARSRLGPCFMDESELAASADLTTELKRALDASRYLVVVCSPRTKNSTWIPKEVAHFANSGRASNILMLLVEGELSPLLPSLLGASSAEPLAADVRALDGRPSGRRRRLALVKLIAPILGVGLDDLMRRSEQRRRRTIALSVLALLAIVVASFTTFFIYKRRAEHFARAQSLAVRAASVVTEKPARSLALAALALQENQEARKPIDARVTDALLAALRNNSGSPLVGHGAAVKSLAFSVTNRGS